MMPTCPSFPALDTTFSNSTPGFWTPAFSRTHRTASVQWSLYTHWITTSISVSPSAAPCLVSSFLSSAIIPPFAGSHHFCPFFTASFLSLLEPEALFPSQAVSPHLSPPSSHQYPSISPFSRKQSDPSVCCRHSASRPDAIPLTLPLLWVNMTHASIILLSFCHYYAPWTSLHLFLQLFSSLLRSPISISLPSVRLTLLVSFLHWWQIPSSVVSHLSGVPPLLHHFFSLSCLLSIPFQVELTLSKHPSPLSVLFFSSPRQNDPIFTTWLKVNWTPKYYTIQ